MYVAINNGTFNEDICFSSSFMLGELICGQGIIIMITALSGMSVGQSVGKTNLWSGYQYHDHSSIRYVCLSVCVSVNLTRVSLS